MRFVTTALLVAALLSGCVSRKTSNRPEVAYRPQRASLSNPVAMLSTALGDIQVELFEDEAPNTVANFVHLAETGAYDGTRFHRVIRGFMMQGGDPNTRTGDRAQWGHGGPGWRIAEEPGARRHGPGILSMANSGPNTGGSQFFVLFGPAPHLDGRHTIFGQVLSGMDVVRKFERIGADSRRGIDQDSFPELLTVRIENKRAHAYVPRKE
jgi:peptidyl-prolyl cis-trans isomerase B (cyclophilin B)